MRLLRCLLPNRTGSNQVTRSVSEGDSGKCHDHSPSLTHRVGKVSAIGLLSAVLLLLSSACQAQTINQKIATFLEGKRSIRVGGGECAHAASEALRMSGAEFISTDLGADYPAAGDFVWGTLLKVVSYSNGKWTDSNPTAKALPGDILQYNNTRIVIGTSTWTATRHTSVAAAVSTAGLPTLIYEQNVNGIRTIQKNSIDLTKLVAGWVRIYRPKARIDQAGQYKFSLVNNMTTSQPVTVKFLTQSLGTVNLGAANTMSSYLMEWVSSSSTTTKFTLVLSNGSTITVDNAAGYEVYVATGGKAALRKLAQ